MTDASKDPQDFAVVLMSHAKGRAHTEATKKLAEVITAVTETGKAGSITVKLQFTADKDNPMLIKVADKVTATIPTEVRRSVWFADDDGSLHRNDPKQGSLFGDEPEDVVPHTPKNTSK